MKIFVRHIGKMKTRATHVVRVSAAKPTTHLMLRQEVHVAGNLFNSKKNTKTRKRSASTDIAVAADVDITQEFSIRR